MALEYYNIRGLDTYDNVMAPNLDGQIIHGVNIVNFPNGAISKRPGYNTFLGTPDNAQVNALMYYPQQTGTQLFLYRASGSQLYYSLQGTGAWTVAQGNGTAGTAGGTIGNGQRMQGAILNNTFITGDGTTATRHTANGTAFTDTVLAPIGQYFMQYHNRIYTTNGINGTITYSSYGSADNWNIAIPADSSSFVVPDAGAAGPMMNSGDRLIITKIKGKMFNWDGNQLIDMATYYGPTMTFSPANIDGYYFYLNQVGQFGFDGANKQMLTNSVQRLFYNRSGNGMAASMLGTFGVGEAHIWDYFATLGTITDDFTGRTVNNAVLKYDYQKDTHLLWQLNDNPTSMLSYVDLNNQRQLIFGNASGQCFQLSPTATSDNGTPIASEAVFVFTYASQATSFSPTSAQSLSGASYEKKWNWGRFFFNPGDEVNIQFAFSNTLTYQHLKWSETINTNQRTGDFWQVSDGVVEIRFPDDLNNPRRSRFMFLRIYDNADNSKWTYLGSQIDAEIQVIK